MRRPTGAFTVLFAILACSPDEGEALRHQIDDAETHVDELRTEIEDHAAAALAAPDLATMQGMEAAHDEVVRGHMDDLAHAMTDMDMCDGVPGDRIDAMMDMHEACDGEHEGHHDAVAAAADVDGARAEEQGHRGDMMDCLDEMGGMMRAMMHDYGAMMCSGHHGMDDHDRP